MSWTSSVALAPQWGTRAMKWARWASFLIALVWASQGLAQQTFKQCVPITSTATGVAVTSCQDVSATNPLPTSVGGASGTASPSTNRSGTVTTGGSFQSVLAASTTRKGCLIENPTTATEPLLVYIGTSGASQATGTSYTLPPGGTFSCASGNLVISDAISVSATTTGHAFTETDQ